MASRRSDLLDRMGDSYRRQPKAQRAKLVADEAVEVHGDIDRMWRCSRRSPRNRRRRPTPKALAKIDELCNAINLKVAMRSAATCSTSATSSRMKNTKNRVRPRGIAAGSSRAADGRAERG
jgi:hypothetical protein